MTTPSRPHATADKGRVILNPPERQTARKPVELTPEAARDLAGELIAAAITAKYGIEADARITDE